MTILRDRLAAVIEECGLDVSHPNLASWESEWIGIWMRREPLELSQAELERLEKIERLVLGVVH